MSLKMKCLFQITAHNSLQCQRKLNISIEQNKADCNPTQHQHTYSLNKYLGKVQGTNSSYVPASVHYSHIQTVLTYCLIFS